MKTRFKNPQLFIFIHIFICYGVSYVYLIVSFFINLFSDTWIISYSHNGEFYTIKEENRGQCNTTEGKAFALHE